MKNESTERCPRSHREMWKNGPNLCNRKCEPHAAQATRLTPSVYLVGGGIASLAAAAFFIRDGDILGHNITIIEESAKIGGSLDAAGRAPEDGYVMRGGRMLESKYLCTYDLFSSIPTLDEQHDGYPGDLRLESDHENLFQVSSLPRPDTA